MKPTLAARFVEAVPEHLIADLAYDGDPLDARFATEGIALIARHRSNRVRSATQDGQPLRRYARRWKVERLFVWLENFRRLAVRYERHLANFCGVVELGCIVLLTRAFMR